MRDNESMTIRSLDPGRPLDPITREFLRQVNAGGGPTLAEMTVEQARGFMLASQPAKYTDYPVDVAERALPGYSFKVVRPRSAESRVPVVIYLHGGGWVLGSSDTHARIVSKIAVQVNCAVVVVDYARAPEARYPVAPEQCIAAIKDVQSHATQFGVDASRIAVAGDSSGGNLAAVVALKARLHHIELALQVLINPVTDFNFDTDSYRSFSDGMNLDRPAMEWFWGHYVPESKARTDSGASPLRSKEEELRDAPPALILTAECDVLRDEGEAYARKLADAGVPVTAMRFLGAVHGFVAVDALASTPAALAGMEMIVAHLRNALSAGPCAPCV